MKKLMPFLFLSFAACSTPVKEAVIYVGPQEIKCMAMVETTCLPVSEHQFGIWQPHFFGIKGFDYRPGFNYKLRIKIETIANPPADGASEIWSLVSILEKKPAQLKESTVYVDTQKVSCTPWWGTNGLCLKVKVGETGSWKSIGKIEGFRYEEGFSYKLSVNIETVIDPPQDIPAENWWLSSIIEKKDMVQPALNLEISKN